MAIHRSRTGIDRGAAAVEFALVLLPLLIVVYGIIDFGRAYNAKETLTQAARVGARLAVVQDPNAAGFSQASYTQTIQNAVVAAASSTLTVAATDVTVGAVCGSGTPAATQITVSVTYDFNYLTPLFDQTIHLLGKATAPC